MGACGPRARGVYPCKNRPRGYNASAQHALHRGTSQTVAEELTGQGRSRLGRPGGQAPSPGRAVATALVRVSAQTVELIRRGGVSAGNVVEVARIAAITAAKHTASLIPLHPAVQPTWADVEFQVHEQGVLIRASVGASDGSVVETQALMAAFAAALTVYDMCRPVDSSISIGAIRASDWPGHKLDSPPTRLRRASQRRAFKKRQQDRSRKGKP